MATGTGRQRIAPLRALFSRELPFRGADIELVRKVARVGWLVAATIGYAVVPAYPPTAQIGSAGWAVTACLSGATLVWIVYLFRRNERVGFNTLMAAAYLGVVDVAVQQWLAGGLPAPYHELYPMMICAGAAVHPPRRFLPLLVVIIAAAIVPEAGHAQSAQLGDLIVELALSTGASFLIVSIVWRIRQGRADLLSKQEQAHELARVDPLTGLGNRRAFEEALSREVAAVRRAGGELSLLVCDLDNFKHINDQHGHLAGDDCLRQVADTLRAEVRLADMCFRWGGDELVVLLAGAGAEMALEVGIRVELLVERSCVRPDGGRLRITTGHATLAAAMDPEDLLDVADAALRQRKDGRRTPLPLG
jgi:diguanylate cyclase (GGDEF)-like protein